MKKNIFVLMLTLLVGDCLYTNIKTPGGLSDQTQYIMRMNEDYTMLGRVQAGGSITTWFWAVARGGNGYFELLEEAKKIGGDDVINVKIDLSMKGAVLFLWEKMSWKATGIAIKFKNPLPDFTKKKEEDKTKSDSKEKTEEKK